MIPQAVFGVAAGLPRKPFDLCSEGRAVGIARGQSTRLEQELCGDPTIRRTLGHDNTRSRARRRGPADNDGNVTAPRRASRPSMHSAITSPAAYRSAAAPADVVARSCSGAM